MFREIDITESYKQLIEDFKDLKIEEEPDPTFLEITGYPHYEKVISNILAHFFNDSNNHGLGITLIQALLSGAGIEVEEVDDEELQVESAKTEVQTENGKFIDLVIETGSYLIGIENKIYASEYNPFRDYESYIKKEATTLNKEPVCILLSLKRDIHHASSNDFFKRVNYADFFKKHDPFAKESTNKNKVDSKFSIFFEDFKQTILNMGRNKFTDEVMKFMTDNLETLNDMKRNIFKKFEDFAREEFKKIDALISQDDEILLSRRSVTVKPDRMEAAIFYNIKKGYVLSGNNSSLTVKVRIRPDGWFIEFWDQDTQKDIFLKTYLNGLNIDGLEKNIYHKQSTDPEKYSYVRRYDFTTETKEIAHDLKGYLKMVSESLEKN